tara:strand:- start:50 stop:400 length:351 start_codon:yes stop_codon:yes gene_type:complete
LTLESNERIIKTPTKQQKEKTMFNLETIKANLSKTPIKDAENNRVFTVKAYFNESTPCGIVEKHHTFYVRCYIGHSVRVHRAQICNALEALGYDLGCGYSIARGGKSIEGFVFDRV